MGGGLPSKFLIIVVAIAAQSVCLQASDRTTISLNGTWQIEDSKDAQAIPVEWKHKAPVPGLAHSAEPGFPHVDEFDSRMLIQNRVSQGNLPKDANVNSAGLSQQGRNWFWYRR